MKQMPIDISGFSHIEYLMVFNTIVFGVVAAEYFTSWGNMLRFRDTVKGYWLHLAWTIYCFLLITQNWYGIWPRTRFVNLHYGYFLYSLVPMFVYYLISVTLFPAFKQGQIIDLKEHFFKNARALFILFSVYFTITIISSFVYIDRGDVQMQNILRGCGLVLSLIAAKYYRVVWFHVILLSFGSAGLIKFILSLLR